MRSSLDMEGDARGASVMLLLTLVAGLYLTLGLALGYVVWGG